MTGGAVANDLAARAREIFAAALEAARPEWFTRESLEFAFPIPSGDAARRHWIIAIGKAAPAMACGALDFAASREIAVAGGIVVAAGDRPADTQSLARHETAARVGSPLLRCDGDHPLPGPKSLHAANELADLCEKVGPDDVVLVLISGGTSALIGAPVEGLSAKAYTELNELLFGAGLAIDDLNIVRKRFSRWGAGRLAAALAPAIVQQVLLSDVRFGDPAVIGSGPCVPDGFSADSVEQTLRRAGLARRLPLQVAAMLGAIIAGTLPETPDPLSPIFANVRPAIVGDNHDALQAAGTHALATLGPQTLMFDRELVGDAAESGREIARAVCEAAPGTCLIYGGETTVRLPDEHGRGGRNEQLALAAAEVLRTMGNDRMVLLAAGTDGTDGSSDAAGALVTSRTWDAIAAAGIDPAAALARCDAHPALDAVGALLRTGPTGTNVADIVIALRA